MSTAPEAAAVGPNVPSVKQRFLNCWSCRIVSGGGLVLSGAYVYNAARKVMRKGVISAGIVGQISFAAGKTGCVGLIEWIKMYFKVRSNFLQVNGIGRHCGWNIFTEYWLRICDFFSSTCFNIDSLTNNLPVNCRFGCMGSCRHCWSSRKNEEGLSSRFQPFRDWCVPKKSAAEYIGIVWSKLKPSQDGSVFLNEWNKMYLYMRVSVYVSIHYMHTD